MASDSQTEGKKAAATGGWHYPPTFWHANSVELFERMAFYGMFIALFRYLNMEVGFTDVGAGFATSFFASFIYLVPTFTGSLSDWMGFRKALALAFVLLTIGYVLLGAFPIKWMAIVSLTLILLGGSFVKPIISGTVAKCSSEENRARAFSIFYMVVNIGSFTGKSFAKPIRVHLGLQYINYYAAAMAFVALILVLLFYRDVDSAGVGKSVRESLRGLGRVVTNLRFMCLILIVAGFWAIQGQLYGAMPTYVQRLIGEHASPEWYANINPFVVVLLVVPITHLVRKMKPISTIGIAMGIIPLSALSVSLSPLLQGIFGNSVPIFGLIAFHPITVMLIIGIAFQGLAECFLSPRYLEFASKQAPPGEVGLYMGYSHLTTFFAWLFTFISAGYLLNMYCPDPATLDQAAQEQYRLALSSGGPFPEAYAHAHYIWYAYAAVGVVAFIALLIYRAVTIRIDRKRDAEAAG